MTRHFCAPSRVLFESECDWASYFVVVLAARAGMAVECSRCRFASAEWANAPTYAFALTLGLNVAASAKDANEKAASEALIGMTSYCTQCAEVCWLARSTSAQEALVTHAVMGRNIRALREYALPGIPK